MDQKPKIPKLPYWVPLWPNLTNLVKLTQNLSNLYNPSHFNLIHLLKPFDQVCLTLAEE